MVIILKSFNKRLTIWWTTRKCAPLNLRKNSLPTIGIFTVILQQTIAADLFDYVPAGRILSTIKHKSVAFCDLSEVASDIIFSPTLEAVGLDIPIKFRCAKSSSSGDIHLADFFRTTNNECDALH